MSLPDLVSGNRMIALGALEAGCRFFAGYPITPSSEIYATMMHELPRRGGIALAAPDEISSIAACVGASLAGHRAMTATSGPGFCLMIETVQYAVMTETPLVLAVVQRLGPSTGGATQGAQGDVLLVEHCTSGGYTIPVFAPSCAADAWELAQRAFAWSERLRTPVVLLSDKEVSMTYETVDRETLPKVDVPQRRSVDRSGARFVPYRAPCPEEAPDFAPVGGVDRVVATGSAHDEQGRLRKNSEEVLDVLRRLQSKIEAHAGEMIYADEVPDAEADTLVISYGVSARAARQACLERNRAGGRVAFLELKTLFPVAAPLVRSRADGKRRVIVVEENLSGLYASVLAPLLGGATLVRIGSIGSMIPPSRVRDALEAA